MSAAPSTTQAPQKELKNLQLSIAPPGLPLHGAILPHLVPQPSLPQPVLVSPGGTRNKGLVPIQLADCKERGNQRTASGGTPSGSTRGQPDYLWPEHVRAANSKGGDTEPPPPRPNPCRTTIHPGVKSLLETTQGIIGGKSQDSRGRQSPRRHQDLQQPKATGWEHRTPA